jgi:regulator of replication initiation timing
MNNKEIKALINCNDILTKECARLRNENEELKNRLSTSYSVKRCALKRRKENETSRKKT